MLANRLRKNLRHWSRWARRHGISCYRLYDADLPEYALAVDRYEEWVHVQEYAAPAAVDPALAETRLREALALLPVTLGVPASQVLLKVRRRQRGASQYERHAHTGRFEIVQEGGLRFLVNLTDYLDTGLFLDHRPTRALLRELASGRRFLNLFAYTGTASVYAAAGGARSTLSVDLSPAYLDWARRNMALNGFPEGGSHRFERADCLGWLARRRGERYDLIFLDPPTFSNSTAMGERTLDIQRDHPALIRAALRLLSPEGLLIFSCNYRQFRMARDLLSDVALEEITAATIPPDFARNPRIHACWRIQPRRAGC
jgi:23S rRNA (guanine2445-N2)-methyltransferase / 23S rRNA (guanine2069-N7)-methyltransferase